MTHSVIQIDGLVKTFGTFRALDGLDLSVTQGEIHGFLGPNGAGKSTTIRVLLGLMRATSGATPGQTPPSFMNGSPTCPATSHYGQG